MRHEAEPVAGKEWAKGGESLGRPDQPPAGTKGYLYLALVDIGRNQKAIRPSYLLAYDSLLESEEVKRRVAPDATREARALAASEALKDAISELVEPNLRLVMEAALCTTDEFEGRTVQYRMTSLEESPARITRDMYWTLRRRGLNQIVKYMGRKDPAPALDSQPLREKDEGVRTLQSGWPLEPSGGALVRLGANAANFYFAMLTCQFVTDFDHSGQPAIDPSLGIVYAFNTYVQLIYADYLPFAFLEDGRSVGELARHNQERWSRFFHDTTPSFHYVVVSAAQYGPFEADHREVLEVYARTRKYVAPLGPDSDEPMPPLFYEVWQPWYARHVALAAQRQPSDIEVITDKARHIFDFLIVRSPLYWPVPTAMRNAQAVLRLMYASQSSLHMDQKQMEDYLTAYFDRHLQE